MIASPVVQVDVRVAAALRVVLQELRVWDMPQARARRGIQAVAVVWALPVRMEIAAMLERVEQEPPTLSEAQPI